MNQPDDICVNKNVLIVDDEEPNLYFLEVLLKSQRCTIASAKNGMEALEALRKDEFDLIVSDILMPKMDGFQLCRNCKSDSRLQNIPFVFYTATYTDKKDEEFALSLGADRFLVKPMEPDKFTAIIKEVLEEKKKGIIRSNGKILKGEEPYLVEYNERIIRKLESKVVQLDEAHKLLGEQEEKYRSIFEQSRDPIILCERDFAIIDVNQAAVNVFGYTKEELLALAHMANLSCDADEWLQMLGVLEKKGYVSDYEMAYRKKDGTRADCLVNVTSRLDERGWVVNYQGIIRDVTERKKAARELQKLNEELEERVLERTAELHAANKELESFSYSVSHDLRAPLRAIDGFSRALAEDYAEKLDSEAQRLIKMIRGSTHDMRVLIEDLLDFSRLGRKEMKIQPIDMKILAEQVLEKLRPIYPGRSAQVRVSDLPAARGDYTLIHEVFVNLLSNAMKFTGTREEACIDVGSREEENEAVYYVKDNGVGFDMEYVDKLFGVFQRLHGREQFEGTGIGLALVQRIIHRHGGRVWAEGKVNEGATFYFSLPKT